MADVGKLLRETTKKLLQRKEVCRVIGFARGNSGLRSTPVFVEDEKDADKLIFDITCGNNLARYLRSPAKTGDGRVGIVAKGCDGRAVVQCMAEGQIKREQVLIIGVPCEGVLDQRKVCEKTLGKDILRYRTEGDKVVFEGKDFEVSVNRTDVLSDSCKRCRYPSPPVHDLFIGEAQAPVEHDFAEVEKFEELEASKRWAFFENEFSRCIRCYACRNACPLCYCEECFVDQTNPQWFGKSTDLSDTMIFHVVRVLHTAGRCVDCGACERACPLGINLGLLNRRVGKEVQERFGYFSGLDPEETPAMATFDEEDKQEFML